MAEIRGAGSLEDLLLALKGLLSQSAQVAGRVGLEAKLAAWREEMDRVWRRDAPALTPPAREDLARRIGEVQLHLQKELQGREREKRALLVRLLSCLAAQNALDSYRRPQAQGFFNRTV